MPTNEQHDDSTDELFRSASPGTSPIIRNLQPTGQNIHQNGSMLLYVCSCVEKNESGAGSCVKLLDKYPMKKETELIDTAKKFVDTFEQVFDKDWTYTKECLGILLDIFVERDL